MKWEEWKSSLKYGRNPCYRCRKNGGDKSGDNYFHYGDGKGGHCFKCGMSQLSDDELQARGLTENFEDEEEFEIVGKEWSEEVHNELKKISNVDSKGFRGIKKEITQYFGVRHEFDTESGEVVRQYYPCTKNGKLSGYKVRIIPKNFDSYGETGKGCDPFGWFRFKESSGQKYCLIAAGEIDCLSAFQMLKEYTDSKGQQDYGYIPVVSSTLGESSVNQLQDKYEWFNRFERIVVCYDPDDAGVEATEKLVKVLPKGKVYVMKLVGDDTNSYLQKGKQKEWINLFFKAEKHTPSGIVGSGQLMDKIKEYVQIPKIPLPPFMHKLQDLMAGGIPLGVIVTLGAASGTGKSSIIDEICYSMYFNSPHKIGVVTLEADSAMYGINILSRHVGKKINLINTAEEKLEFLNSPEVVEAAQKLWYTDEGDSRFYIVEDRDGSIEDMKSLINNLIIGCGCRVVVLDPVSDILEGASNEEQASFYKWMKGMVKSHLVTFIQVAHVRKNSGGNKANSTGAELHEEDFFGSSSIFKSSACNLLFMRDKEAEDEFTRNLTRMKASKIRWTGRTSPFAGEYYYDNNSHTMFDKDDWLANNSQEF